MDATRAPLHARCPRQVRTHGELRFPWRHDQLLTGHDIRFEELRFVCQEAAKDHLDATGRPLPPAVVLPGPDRTRIVRLPDFPEGDEERHAFLQRFARDEVEKNLVPCWGFLAEAAMGETDVVIAVYGARRHAPVISAATINDDGTLGEFLDDEQLDPTAMPFLHPLQHAVDAMASVAETPTPIDAALKGTDLRGGNLPMVD